MITQKKTANAVGGKTARACESCLKKRARWFCSADDAFLCQACDSSVHSANELAGRHKRVRLDSAAFTFDLNTVQAPDNCTTAAAWHQGFKKKARTPRHAKPSWNCQLSVVPEIWSDNDRGSVEENEEQMIFSVPTFDPFIGKELTDDINGVKMRDVVLDDGDDEFNISLIGFERDNWFLPTENELAEFTADVQGLLQQEEEIIKFEEENHQFDNQGGVCWTAGSSWAVKIEEEGETTHRITSHFDWSIDFGNEMLNFDLNRFGMSQVSGGVGDEEKILVATTKEGNGNNMQAERRRKILLRLNYEEVINAWANQGCSSPWTTGARPEFDPDCDAWPDGMEVESPTRVHHQGEEVIGVRGHMNGGDRGREARVSRYREKRRTRLFSKKIRYEVRKLNAEKRPRLKGRFVKRTSLSPVVGVGVGSTISYTNK